VSENRTHQEGRPREFGNSLSPRHLVVLSLLLTVGCHWPGQPNPDERPVPPEYVLEFDALFKRNCAGCHGPDGTLGPAPPLNDPLFRAIVSEKELEAVISKGRRSASGTDKDPRTPMPGFAREQGGTLSPAQIQVLVYEIKGIRYRIEREGENYDARVELVKDDKGTTPRWGTTPRPADNVPPYLGSGSGDSKRGAHVFANACAVCHGKAGKGGKQEEVDLTINDPALLALVSDKVLRRIAITGRPDLGMPNYAEKGEARMDDFKPLTAQDITDLSAYLASWRKETAPRGN
jgi:cytochrome c oxidase cbb3-type subunit III